MYGCFCALGLGLEVNSEVLAKGLAVSAPSSFSFFLFTTCQPLRVLFMYASVEFPPYREVKQLTPQSHGQEKI